MTSSINHLIYKLIEEGDAFDRLAGCMGIIYMCEARDHPDKIEIGVADDYLFLDASDLEEIGKAFIKVSDKLKERSR